MVATSETSLHISIGAQMENDSRLENRHTVRNQNKDHDDIFSKRMRAAGILPNHRIGIAVSGGPDSMALCVLISRWKKLNNQTKMDCGCQSDGLVGFVVDHCLRANSGAEALLVRDWVMKLGIRCEVLKCTWAGGIPAQGHLQEAARNARYNLLQNACKRESLDVLLTAHHADDQVELFVIRLSRHSGVAGLAGMAFVKDLFPRGVPECSQSGSYKCLTLVRPLLDFCKDDLYHLCRKASQSWVEDPTNTDLAFMRNKIRQILGEPQYCLLKEELQDVIALCRRTREVLDVDGNYLLKEAVCVDQDYGFVILDVEKLRVSHKNDVVLSRVLMSLLQFVAQKDKPPRGRAVQSLLESVHKRAIKGAFTLGGCCVFPVPGSKGSRLLICFSYDSPRPSTASSLVSILPESSLSDWPSPSQTPHLPNLSLDKISELSARIPFVKSNDSASLLDEANSLGVLSDRSRNMLLDLTNKLSKEFGTKLSEKSYQSNRKEVSTDYKLKAFECAGRESTMLPFGFSCYFIDRFLIFWGQRPGDYSNLVENSANLCASKHLCLSHCHTGKLEQVSCHLMCKRPDAFIRDFKDEDLLQLSGLASNKHDVKPLSLCNFSSEDVNFQESRYQEGLKACSNQISQYQQTCCLKVDETLYRHCGRKPENFELTDSQGLMLCGDYVRERAREALLRLKRIPCPARRGLPVLVTAQGALLGIPSLYFSRCPYAYTSAVFLPRIPLAGGRASWL